MLITDIISPLALFVTPEIVIPTAPENVNT